MFHFPFFLTQPTLDTVESNDRSRKRSDLRNVAYALIRLDVWTLDTIVESNAATPQLVALTVYHKFRALVSGDIRDLIDDINEDDMYEDKIYEDKFEKDVQDKLGELSDERVLEILCDLQTSAYYAQFIQLRTLLYTTVQAEHKYATAASDLTVPKKLVWLETPQHYLKHLVIEISENKMKLNSVVICCRAL